MTTPTLRGTAACVSAIQANHRPILRQILVAVIAISFCLEFIFWAGFLLSPLRYRTDFRQLYVAGYMARTGRLHQLYDLELQHRLQNALVSPEQNVLPFNHPYFEALWFVPFSILRYQFAFFAWLLANLCLLGVSLELIRHAVHEPGLSKQLQAAILLSFVPVQVALLQGQDSLLLLTTLCVTFFQLCRNRESAAGAVLALGLFKFQIVVPIAFLFLLKRRWQLVGAFAAAGAALAAISTSLVGLAQTRTYLHTLTAASTGIASPSRNYGIQWEKMATLRGLAVGLGSSHFSSETVQLAALLLSVLLILAVAILVPKGARSSELLPVFIVASALAGYYVFTHDLSVLLIPIFFALAYPNCAAWSPWLAYSGAAALSAPLLLFVAPNHFYLVSFFLIEFLVMMSWSARAGASSISGQTQ